MEANLENKNTQTAARHNTIKHVVAVMSGKGGVGKSFVTGLLASGLAAGGHKVGILDADFTKSSIPILFGLHGSAKVGQYSFQPFESRLGIKVISTNLLFENDDQPVLWKEALIGNVINQLWLEVEWGELDYLLVDMPPAVSEASVAVLQLIPFTGAVIVSTPQWLSAKINSKAVSVVQGTGLPIIGVVENMSRYLNPAAGEKLPLFERDYTKEIANAVQSPILSRMPFDAEIARLCDFGKIEDVDFDERDGLVDAFVEAVSAAAQKRALEQMKKQNNSGASVENAGQDTVEEEILDSSVSSSQTDHSVQRFSETAIYFIRSGENVGVLENPDAQGHFLGACGDRMQIHLKLINNRIVNAKFLADGCGATQACGTMVTKMACTKTLEEAERITSEEVIEALDGLPDDHLHCAELAVMALREAVIDAVEGHGKIK